MGFLGRFAPQIYAIVRIVIGFSFMQHGAQKLFNIPAFVNPCPCIPMPDMSAQATFIMVIGIMELVFGLCVMIGLFTRLMAFLASGMMAVAYFMGHQGQGALPIQNQGEPAVLYCFIFLLIAAHGSGICSIDSMMGKSKPANDET
jgi:putative oxidoreductase